MICTISSQSAGFIGPGMHPSGRGSRKRQSTAKFINLSAKIGANPPHCLDPQTPRREKPSPAINFINLAAIIGANPPNRRRGQSGGRGTGSPLPFSAIFG